MMRIKSDSDGDGARADAGDHCLQISRRRFLEGTVVGAVGLMTSARSESGQDKPAVHPSRETAMFRYCLNTSTIRGQKLGILQEIKLAARAGYDGIEPWLDEIQLFQQSGGTLKELKHCLDDVGIRVESAIAFPYYMVDDAQERTKGLEEAKRAMDIVRELGGTHIAAPPAGITQQSNIPLTLLADRYRELCEVGDQAEVSPQLELWGFSQSLSRLGEVAYVATEAAHPRACLLLDAYHIYKGGSRYEGLALLSGQRMACFHINDYPAVPPRATIADKHRVYPGDGVAPLRQMIGILKDIGFRGALSLELFNPEYWSQDAETVARTGLAKIKQVVASAVHAEQNAQRS